MVARLIAYIYAIVNIIAAAYIFFAFPLPGIIKIFLIFILLIKGVPSFAGDILCKIDGVVDVTAALALAGLFIIPNPISILMVLMLVWVALLSFF